MSEASKDKDQKSTELVNEAKSCTLGSYLAALGMSTQTLAMLSGVDDKKIKAFELNGPHSVTLSKMECSLIAYVLRLSAEEVYESQVWLTERRLRFLKNRADLAEQRLRRRIEVSTAFGLLEDMDTTIH
jgi:hypothetical protein